MRSNFLFLFFISLLLLAGCNNEKNNKSEDQSAAMSQNKGQELTACTILTKADIEAVTGEAMNAGQSRGFECKFTSIATDENDIPKITIRVHLEFSSQTPQEQLNVYNANMSEGLGKEFKPTPIKGVGDAANWDDQYGVIMASKALGNSRSAFVLIQPIDVAKDKAFDIAKPLALKAFDNLER